MEILKRCLRVGCVGGIRMNRLPRGYDTSRHVMSYRERNVSTQDSAPPPLSTRLDLVERRADLGRQWDEEEV
jgi:hypothetical protein